MGLFFVTFVFFVAFATFATASNERAELYRRVSNGVNETNAQSANNFRSLFDENVLLIIHRGAVSADDTSRGVDALVNRGANWFRKGLAAKSIIMSYTDSSDGDAAFITGIYEFAQVGHDEKVFSWSTTRVEYSWSAIAHWVGNRIIRYELFSEFSHLETQLERMDHKEL